jgi:hypothetical protein
MQNQDMKPPPIPPEPPQTDLRSAVLDFIERERRAQAAVDQIFSAEPERRCIKRPTSHT